MRALFSADFPQTFPSIGDFRSSCGCLLLLFVASCQTGVEIRPDVGAIETTARQAQECRYVAARKPEYQVLLAHMPLADIDQVDLVQMADTRLISPSEITALTDWSHEVQQCRNEIVATATHNGLSNYVPIVLANWDRQDRIVVQLVQRKIPWGEAVLQLKTSKTVLLAGINEENERRGSALTRSTEAQQANRAALLNAFARLVP
jgi:hypothetical protein